MLTSYEFNEMISGDNSGVMNIGRPA